MGGCHNLLQQTRRTFSAMGSHISYLKETAGWSSLSEEEDRMKIVEDLSVDSENVMTAVVYKQHGSVDDCLEIAIVNRPKPLPGQILVKVHAYGINKADTRMLENHGNGRLLQWNIFEGFIITN